MYIMPSAEGGIFLPFKGEKKHIKHYILWYELFTLHRYRGYPDFKVLILFMPESTEGVRFVYRSCRWKEKITYRVPGVAYPADRAVQFDLTTAYEIHEGRVMEP